MLADPFTRGWVPILVFCKVVVVFETHAYFILTLWNLLNKSVLEPLYSNEFLNNLYASANKDFISGE